jgi:subtilase family serine protease
MTARQSRRWRIAACVAAGVTAIAVTAVAPSASAATARRPLPGSTPKWLTSAQKVSATAATSKVSFGILLALRNQSAAESTLQRLSSPSSADYGKWLSNAQFNARYAPAKSDVSSVQAWLKAQGFAVVKTLPSGQLVEASGTAAQVQKTFSTTLGQYKYKGKVVRSNATPLSLPTGAPAAIAGVLGIDQGAALKFPADTEPGPPPGARYGVQPCSSYYGQRTATNKPSAYGKKEPYVVCGYGPQQYQSAYGERSLLAHGITGRGVTVAITDAYASPTIFGDAQTYNSVHHQPLFKAGQFRQIVPPADGYDMVGPTECDAQGWYGEETLDVEAVHAMAPGAKIVYVGGADCVAGLDDAWATTIDNHVADIITNSWTDGIDDINLLGQDYVDFYVQFSLEAALTGITVNFASGDSGDHTAGGTNLADKTVEFPADVPYVTGVGGSSVLINKQGKRVGEYGWQSAYSALSTDGHRWTPAPPGPYSSGGGGGTSVLFAQPFYQRYAVPTSISEYYGSTPARAVPDIAMPADPNTGFEVGQTQVFPDGTYWDQYRIGGTSLASPLLAGVIAVADQLGHRSLGFLNPLYYGLLHTSAFYDVKAPSRPLAEVRTDYANFVDGSDGLLTRLRTIDVQTSTLHSTPGYDDETGVGTPNGASFFAEVTRGGHR